jgi:hypothetical protein
MAGRVTLELEIVQRKVKHHATPSRTVVPSLRVM